jgi:hypothetical protein
VIKSHREIDNSEHCPECATISTRTIAKHQSVDKTSASDWNAKTWQPATGKHMTPSELKKHAKAKGWDEVGTESVEKIHKNADLAKEQQSKDSWEKTLSTDLGTIDG